jgi:hypothetical protein
MDGPKYSPRFTVLDIRVAFQWARNTPIDAVAIDKKQ